MLGVKGSQRPDVKPVLAQLDRLAALMGLADRPEFDAERKLVLAIRAAVAQLNPLP